MLGVCVSASNQYYSLVTLLQINNNNNKPTVWCLCFKPKKTNYYSMVPLLQTKKNYSMVPLLQTKQKYTMVPLLQAKKPTVWCLCFKPKKLQYGTCASNQKYYSMVPVLQTKDFPHRTGDKSLCSNSVLLKWERQHYGCFCSYSV